MESETTPKYTKQEVPNFQDSQNAVLKQYTDLRGMRYTLNRLELDFLKMPKSVISYGFQPFSKKSIIGRLEYTWNFS